MLLFNALSVLSAFTFFLLLGIKLHHNDLLESGFSLSRGVYMAFFIIWKMIAGSLRIAAIAVVKVTRLHGKRQPTRQWDLTSATVRKKRWQVIQT